MPVLGSIGGVLSLKNGAMEFWSIVFIKRWITVPLLHNSINPVLIL